MRDIERLEVPDGEPPILQPDEILVPGTVRYAEHDLELAWQRGEVSGVEYMVMMGELHNLRLVEALGAECATADAQVAGARNGIADKRTASSYKWEHGAACLGLALAACTAGTALSEWAKTSSEQSLLMGAGSALALVGLRRVTKRLAKIIESPKDAD